MKYFRGIALSIFLALGSPLNAQRVIPLYSGPISGSESWTQQEREYFSKDWQTQIVANVTRPTLTAYLPAPDKATGTAVVIAPGGGFYALSINSEGIDVAKWLASRGVAAFVLKYRLIKSGDNAPADFNAAMQTPGAFETASRDVIPLAIADGRNAVAYVRSHAAEFGVAPDRVGLMGFSAGGTVVTGVAFQYDKDSRPAFLAPIYAYTGAVAPAAVPSDAPPIFVVAATDDELGLAPQSVDLYAKWAAAKKPSELHMYSKGGHGFGMHAKGTPSDTWIERFGDWLGTQGLLKK
jgi:acetyl esterase/lipase